MGRLAGHLLIWACLLHSVTAGFDNDGQCIFPFRFKDELYYDCIKFKTKHKWCSLNKTFIGYWKFCNWEAGASDHRQWLGPDETAGQLAGPGPGTRVAGAEDVDSAELLSCSLYVNRTSGPSGEKENDQCDLVAHLHPPYQDPPECSFPFLFRKKFIYKCTKDGYILDRSWCSLTKNYNKDGKWKQCSPQK
ncbi:Bovine seminal plasma protein like protein 1 [Tupaia chinensis]|uniref:Seminal plasma protein like protein 1 n=1 Tax=Tupaia chinensis TaxID=246437 RepID=L9L827_TUPCH|nr:Bovine seminal plasma protein like protein 1 [Tupaia chinensis]